jgi:drug/metabolite transporter (DMT)-like permease
MQNNSLAKTLLTTFFALVAFAGNSILCRLALENRSIDASNFTVIRLFSGAVILLIILKLSRGNSESSPKGSWVGALMLFAYASTFSFAYMSLDTGTGALILFGSVQLTMITIAVVSGDRLHLFEWIGVGVAFAGFVYLVLPKVTTPSFIGFVLMTLAGISWGIYTLMGRGSESPLSDTAYNFTRTIPFIIVMGLLFIQTSHLSQKGVFLAVLSGALASGIGYTIWYIALGGLSVTIAAVAQLLVPVLAALGGAIFVSETISFHFLLSAAMILGGIALVVLGKHYFVNSMEMK